MVVVLLSSEDIPSHVEDAVHVTKSLPDGLLCHDGVLVRLIPICADANNDDFMMHLWDLGETKLALGPDKFKRSMNKRKELIKNTGAWQILQTLLGIYAVVSECSDTAIDRIAEDAHDAKNSMLNDTVAERNGNGWGYVTKACTSGQR
jgi:hypothetical protein